MYFGLCQIIGTGECHAASENGELLLPLRQTVRRAGRVGLIDFYHGKQSLRILIAQVVFKGVTKAAKFTVVTVAQRQQGLVQMLQMTALLL